MPIHGKNSFIIFFSGLERLKTVKLGMQHWILWPYKVYVNGDYLLILTYFKYEKLNNKI